MESIPRPGGGDLETERAAIARALRQKHVWPDRNYKKARVDRHFQSQREKQERKKSTNTFQISPNYKANSVRS